MKYILLIVVGVCFFATYASAQEELGQIGNKRYSCVVSKSGQLKVNRAAYESAQAAMEQDEQVLKNTRLDTQLMVKKTKTQQAKSVKDLKTAVFPLIEKVSSIAFSDPSNPNTVENILKDNDDTYGGNKGRSKLERHYNRFLNQGVLKENAPPYDSWKNFSVQEALDSLNENARSKKEIRALYKALKEQMKACKGCALKRELRSDGTLKKMSKRRQRRRKCRCREVEKSATLVIKSGEFGQCACYNVAFVQWERNLTNKASSVTAVIDWIGGGAVERPTAGSDPFNNSFSLGDGEPMLTVPAGSNWIKVADNYAADFNLERCSPDCAAGLANLQAFIQNPRIRPGCS